MGETRRLYNDPRIRQIVDDRFAKDPRDLFSGDKLAELRSEDQSTRVAVLAHISEFLCITPTLVKAYSRGQITLLSKKRSADAYAKSPFNEMALRDLRDGLGSSDTVFHLVLFGPHLLAFVRSSPSEDGAAVYLGSLNSSRQVAGADVGMTLGADAMDVVGRNADIVAKVARGGRDY